MLANLGLWNGTPPSAPSMQVKGLQAYATLPKLDVSSQLGQSLNQDKILGWPDGGGRTGDGAGIAP